MNSRDTWRRSRRFRSFWRPRTEFNRISALSRLTHTGLGVDGPVAVDTGHARRDWFVEQFQMALGKIFERVPLFPASNSERTTLAGRRNDADFHNYPCSCVGAMGGAAFTRRLAAKVVSSQSKMTW